MTSGSLRLLSLLPEVVHRLSAAGDLMHAHRGLTTGMRGLLMGLAQHGPRTASQMADQRPVSRQYVQRLVDELLERGLVAATSNPRHRRSPLIALTDKGSDVVRNLTAAEGPHLARLFEGLGASDIAATVRVMEVLSERMSPEALANLRLAVAMESETA